MRDDAGLPSFGQTSETGQYIVATDVVRIGVGIHHPQDRLVRKSSQRGGYFGRHGFCARIHHQDSVVAHLGRDVAGGAHQHVDVALHLQDPDVIRGGRRLAISAGGRKGGHQYQRGFTLHSKSPRQRQ